MVVVARELSGMLQVKVLQQDPEQATLG
jgi:hypothetical protein